MTRIPLTLSSLPLPEDPIILPRITLLLNAAPDLQLEITEVLCTEGLMVLPETLQGPLEEAVVALAWSQSVPRTNEDMGPIGTLPQAVAFLEEALLRSFGGQIRGHIGVAAAKRVIDIHPCLFFPDLKSTAEALPFFEEWGSDVLFLVPEIGKADLRGLEPYLSKGVTLVTGFKSGKELATLLRSRQRPAHYSEGEAL